MQKYAVMYAFAAAALLVGCGNDADPRSTLPPLQEVEPVLTLPGTLQLPGADGFAPVPVEEYDAVLLYCWIPIGEYEDNQADLFFLADLEERNIAAFPIQFSHDVRNAAQAQLNTLGIPLAVALGDQPLQTLMGLDMLPVALYVLSTGEGYRAVGFGCAERAVRGGSE